MPKWEPHWFKLWPEKLLTPDFFMLSERARSTLVFALVLAARAKPKGMTMAVSDLQVLTAIPLAKQRLALVELEKRGMIQLLAENLDAPLYDEMQAPLSNAERQRLARERNAESNGQRNDESNDAVTVAVTKKDRDTEPYLSPVASQPPRDTGGSVKPRRRSEQTSILEPEWLVALRADVEAIKSREIASLTVDERFAVARYHAAVFGHCRVKEPTNRAKAGGVATSLTHFIAHLERQRIEGMTVSQYFKYGTRHHERIGRGVWLRPADLVADLEVVA